MAQLSDFISRIFSTDRTQGLSGGAEVVIDSDPASAFYASRLRKHRTDEDLVATPGALWSTASYQGRGGLRAHLQAERADGVASFTDVLVVLNSADAQRAGVGASGGWTQRSAEMLGDKFVGWADKERFELLYGTRPLRFRFVEDGSPEMLGQSFGLGPGEFVTGLLPNLYSGPGPRSRPVLSIHVNLPGVWEGYREVGRLFSDNILFTLGRHWLDNYHHPALREPGLYRLQQYPDGTLVHLISPELQDRYVVRSDALDGGASVLTVAERTGNPLAYLVLAVIERQVPLDGSSMVFEVEHGEGGPVLSPVMARDEAPAPTPASVSMSSESAARARMQKTIIPDAVEARICTVQERGALLQKVHFANFMEGYDVYVGSGCRVATQMVEPRATLRVRGARVSLVVHDAAVKVAGRAAQVGVPTPLAGTIDIEVDGNVLQYRDLSGVDVDGWPYLAELRRPGAGIYLDFGAPHRVGRDRRCKIRLPDEPHNDHIAWLPQVGGGATIRSRTGDIPKSRFYTDSIMVASEHAEFDLSGEPVLRSLARHCHTFLRRGGTVLSLAPREGASDGAREAVLLPGDEVLVGNCLFQVSYPPIESALSPVAAPTLPPAPPLLEPSAAAREPTLPFTAVEVFDDDLEPFGRAGPVTMDVPAAVGLGERGPAPRPVASVGLAGGADVPQSVVAAPPRSAIDAPSLPPMDRLRAAAPAAPAAQTPLSLGRSTPAQAAMGRGPAKPPVVTPFAPAVAPPMLVDEPGFGVEPPEPPRAPRDEAPLFVEVSDVAPEGVASVDEETWQLELARPARLVLVGWMISGEVTVGNHHGAGVVLPEVRAVPDQRFTPVDYVQLNVRGKRGSATVLRGEDARIEVAGAEVPTTDALDGATLAIVRRDQLGDPDFDIALRVVVDPTLPDPRARLLRVDTEDRLVAALFTLGFGRRADRRVRIGPVEATFNYDGATLRIDGYLATYRGRNGKFQPFFVKEGGERWRTFPEDGARVELSPGDALLAGNAVWRFEV